MVVVSVLPREALLVVVVALHGGEGGVLAGRRAGASPALLLVVLGRGCVLVVVGGLGEDRRLQGVAVALRAERGYPALAPRWRVVLDLGIVVVAALRQACGWML